LQCRLGAWQYKFANQSGEQDSVHRFGFIAWTFMSILFALLALVVFLGIFENRQHHIIAILGRHTGLPQRLM
jgi:hypothetical protein